MTSLISLPAMNIPWKLLNRVAMRTWVVLVLPRSTHTWE